MLIIILFIIVVVIAIFISAARKPDNFRVERRIVIDASRETIFPLINDFKKWVLWSPWEKMDPALQRQYSGSDEGVGTAYDWQGNKNVGSGRMEIVDSNFPEKIMIALYFYKPFEANHHAEFTFITHGQKTEITWAMFGKNLWIGKIMSIFCNMDKMVGKNLEQGLQDLKIVSEKK